MEINYDDIAITEAISIQEEIRKKIVLQPFTKSIKVIAGVDISFNKYSTTVYAGIILLRFPDFKPIAHSLAKAEVTFPYVPGFLAFREIPAIVKAWNLLPSFPDILILDGQGTAHPRRAGIASQFGVLTDQVTIGSAKKLLFGKYEEPGNSKYDSNPIYDKKEIIGSVLRTKNNVKPVFVSPGNKMDIESSLSIVSKCVGKYRIPEPTRLAHEMVNLFRLGKLKEGYTVLNQNELF